jgi:transposase InsO family protein
LKQDFAAPPPDLKGCGDIIAIPTARASSSSLASVRDLCAGRLPACPTSERPDAALASDAMKIAAAVRGGRVVIEGVIFHADRGPTYTANDSTKLPNRRLILAITANSRLDGRLMNGTRHRYADGDAARRPSVLRRG